MQCFKPNLQNVTPGANCFEIVSFALYMILRKNNTFFVFLKENLIST